MAVLTELKMRLNLNCPLVFVPGYLVLNWMETEDPTTDTAGSDGSEGEPKGGGVHACTEGVRDGIYKWDETHAYIYTMQV